jgi:hypothetical protein
MSPGDPSCAFGPALAPQLAELPALVRGWTSSDGHGSTPDGPTHAVRPDPWPQTPPVAGETLCGHYAYLDWLRRAFDRSAGGACAACVAELDAQP